MIAPTETTEDQSTSLRGLTLIEVMISVSIIVIVTSFVFAQRGDFSRSVNLDNIAYEMALVIRQAQSYGITSRGSTLDDNTDEFSYSVLFDTSTPQEFILFRDAEAGVPLSCTGPPWQRPLECDGGGPSGPPGGGSSGGDELIESYRLPAEMEIVRICVNSSVNDTDCNSGDEDDLLINFSRPNPDAGFFTRDGSPISGDTAVIVIEETESGNTDSVIIRSSGYITTQ